MKQFRSQLKLINGFYPPPYPFCTYEPFLTVLFLLSFLFAVNSETQNNHDREPAFTSPIKNISVSVGREAVLSCFVENLQDFKVGWMRAADQTVLALQGRVVTHNSRYSVVNEEMKVWRLKINNIRESDRGCYMYDVFLLPFSDCSLINPLLSVAGAKSTRHH